MVVTFPLASPSIARSSTRGSRGIEAIGVPARPFEPFVHFASRIRSASCSPHPLDRLDVGAQLLTSGPERCLMLQRLQLGGLLLPATLTLLPAALCLLPLSSLAFQLDRVLALGLGRDDDAANDVIQGVLEPMLLAPSDHVFRVRAPANSLIRICKISPTARSPTEARRSSRAWPSAQPHPGSGHAPHA